jgi:predicted ATPase/DNA-binding SARP family transcriptional activator
MDEFGLLGPLLVRRDGAPLPLGGPKLRTLLAILTLEANKVVSADHLVDSLWGENPPETARNTLQVYVSQLRKLLSPGALETAPPGYRLVVDPDAVDLLRFERLAVRGRTALAAGDAATAAEELAEALALWRGPPLADLAWEEFAQSEILRLDELHLATLEDRIDADLALGRHAALVAELERLIAENPFRERLRAQLMLALYRAGRQADALAVYQRTRRTLVDELGIEPGETLQQLERAILEHDPALDPPAARRPPQRVPVPPTPLLGRERELAALADLFRRDDVRLVTLSGPGGIGKTRLALELARRLAPEFRDGSAAAFLATIHDPALVARTILHAVGVQEAVQDPEEALVRVLAGAELLLLVDNFEQVLPAAGTVARLLETAPALKVVATSRARLRIAGEHEFSVPPLADDEAAELFVARAQAAKPDFAVSEQNAAAVAELCARLDGLPLAIELAAARTKLLPPAAMLSRLGNRLELLTGGRRDAPQHQQTLRTTLDWSYDLLGEDEQRLFAQLGVFAGGCTLASAEDVCRVDGSVLEGLAALVDESLVRQADGDEPRFSMLETVREYSLLRLAASGMEQEVRRRHLEHVLAFAEEAEPRLMAKEQAVWLGRCEAEHDNLRAAFAFALASGDGEAALRLAVALRHFWQLHGHLAEGRQALEDALAATPDEPSGRRTYALNSAGILAGEQGDLDYARLMFEAGLEAARGIDDPRPAATTLVNLGNLAFFSDELDKARKLYSQAIECFTAIGDLRSMAIAKDNLGLLALTRGDLAEAVVWLTEARDESRKAGDEHELAAASRSLAAALLELDDAEEVPALLAESLNLSRGLGEPLGVAVCLDTYAGLAATLGDAERAATLFGASDAVRASVGALRQPDQQKLYDRWLARTLTLLDTATYTARYEEGHAMSLEEGCAFAIAVGSAVTRGKAPPSPAKTPAS